MKLRNLAALLLAVLLLFAGCSRINETENTVENTSAASGPENPESHTEEGYSVPPKPVDSIGIEPVYPEPIGTDTDAENFVMGESYSKWWENHRDDVIRSHSLQTGMDGFYQEILQNILTSDTVENTVCSPLNLYLAMAMLAEVSGGSSREQILEALGADDIESLRERVSALWSANYADTPVLTSLLADSVWLSNNFPYREETLSRLAQDYFAASFVGEMGSEEFNRRLQKWTDDNTGGLLSDYTKDMRLEPETVLALVSTIYYKAAWCDEFVQSKTDRQIFHGVSGDHEVPMMHSDRTAAYYRTDRFSAVSLGLSDSGSMFFFLPEEGVSTEDLAADPNVLGICRGTLEVESGYPIVHLSVPKFEVSQKTDLTGTLLQLGITDVLNSEKADFSPLTDDSSDIFLSSAEHAAMVKIDEEGVTGAAYTAFALAADALPLNEVYFTLDRPFLFAVTASDGSILFAGIIQNL